MIIIGDNFFDGLQVIFGTMLVWSEVGVVLALISNSLVYLRILSTLEFLIECIEFCGASLGGPAPVCRTLETRKDGLGLPGDITFCWNAFHPLAHQPQESFVIVPMGRPWCGRPIVY